MLDDYMVEINNHEWVQEVLSERFDDALELMPNSTIVYGGAVRDVIAGFELLGDLDLAVTRRDFKEISQKLFQSPRWAPYTHIKPYTKAIREASIRDKTPFPIDSMDLATESAPMSAISSFVTLGGGIVQLISVKEHGDLQGIKATLEFARTVDITCCGVVLLNDGSVLEVVPGAYQDCIDKVLTINPNSNMTFIDALPHRVKMLEERGWTNKINVEKAMHDLKEKLSAQKSGPGSFEIGIDLKKSDSLLTKIVITNGTLTEDDVRSTCTCAVYYPNKKVNETGPAAFMKLIRDCARVLDLNAVVIKSIEGIHVLTTNNDHSLALRRQMHDVLSGRHSRYHRKDVSRNRYDINYYTTDGYKELFPKTTLQDRKSSSGASTSASTSPSAYAILSDDNLEPQLIDIDTWQHGDKSLWRTEKDQYGVKAKMMKAKIGEFSGS